MDGVDRIELGELIDGQKVRAHTVVFLFTAFLVMISDGYDLSAMGYVGPELVRAWHIQPADLVPVYSAGIVGLLVGGPLLGFLGDRIGRKAGVLLGLCLFGLVTLLSAEAASLNQFALLRFLTGVGLGGVIPNLTALTAEYAPKPLRGTFIVIVNFGVPLGISVPGLVTATLVPQYGWPILLIVGGIMPLVIALLSFFVLRESIRFLATRPHRADVVRRFACIIRPDLAIGPATDLFVARHGDGGRGAMSDLFAGSLGAITPLLWAALAANQMANFFTLTWLPSLLQSMGSQTATAGANASLFSLGGILGGLVMAFAIDRVGVIPMVVLFCLGAPMVAAIGTPGLPLAEHRAVIAAAGFCITGINFGMTATLGMIYPTRVRSLGIGWGGAAGRLGGLAAPLVGGVLLAHQVSVSDVLLAPALVVGLGGVASMILAALCARRFGGLRLDEAPLVRPP